MGVTVNHEHNTALLTDQQQTLVYNQHRLLAVMCAKACHTAHEERSSLTLPMSSYHHSSNSQGICLLANYISYGVCICV